MKPKSSKRCILQVEDEDADAYIMQFAFRRVGIDAVLQVVTDGGMAIDYLSGEGDYKDRSQYPLPDLLLLDLKLPKRSGMELLEWIRSNQELRHIVVIVCSSSAQPGDLERAYKLGVNSFVQKPIGLESTLRLVEGLKLWWLELNQFAPEPGENETHPELPGLLPPTLDQEAA